jgi:hypothetical protein
MEIQIESAAYILLDIIPILCSMDLARRARRTKMQTKLHKQKVSVPNVGIV